MKIILNDIQSNRIFDRIVEPDDNVMMAVNFCQIRTVTPRKQVILLSKRMKKILDKKSTFRQLGIEEGDEIQLGLPDKNSRFLSDVFEELMNDECCRLFETCWKKHFKQQLEHIHNYKTLPEAQCECQKNLECQKQPILLDLYQSKEQESISGLEEGIIKAKTFCVTIYDQIKRHGRNLQLIAFDQCLNTLFLDIHNIEPHEEFPKYCKIQIIEPDHFEFPNGSQHYFKVTNPYKQIYIDANQTYEDITFLRDLKPWQLQLCEYFNLKFDDKFKLLVTYVNPFQLKMHGQFNTISEALNSERVTASRQIFSKINKNWIEGDIEQITNEPIKNTGVIVFKDTEKSRNYLKKMEKLLQQSCLNAMLVQTHFVHKSFPSNTAIMKDLFLILENYKRTNLMYLYEKLEAHQTQYKIELLHQETMQKISDEFEEIKGTLQKNDQKTNFKNTQQELLNIKISAAGIYYALHKKVVDFLDGKIKNNKDIDPQILQRSLFYATQWSKFYDELVTENIPPSKFARYVLQNKIGPKGMENNLQMVYEALTRISMEPLEEDFQEAIKKQQKLKKARDRKKKKEIQKILIENTPNEIEQEINFITNSEEVNNHLKEFNAIYDQKTSLSLENLKKLEKSTLYEEEKADSNFDVSSIQDDLSSFCQDFCDLKFNSGFDDCSDTSSQASDLSQLTIHSRFYPNKSNSHWINRACERGSFNPEDPDAKNEFLRDLKEMMKNIDNIVPSTTSQDRFLVTRPDGLKVVLQKMDKKKGKKDIYVPITVLAEYMYI